MTLTAAKIEVSVPRKRVRQPSLSDRLLCLKLYFSRSLAIRSAARRRSTTKVLNASSTKSFRLSSPRSNLHSVVMTTVDLFSFSRPSNKRFVSTSSKSCSSRRLALFAYVFHFSCSLLYLLTFSFAFLKMKEQFLTWLWATAVRRDLKSYDIFIVSSILLTRNPISRSFVRSKSARAAQQIRARARLVGPQARADRSPHVARCRHLAGRRQGVVRDARAHSLL